MIRKHIYSKRNLNSKKVVAGYVFVVLCMVLIAWIYKEELSLIVKDPELVRSFLQNLGVWGPIVLILLQTFQVVIFVIPGPVFTVAGGYAFGTVLGTIYSLIGTLLGSVVVFKLAKWYGRPFVERIVDERELKHFDAFYRKKGNLALFISRTIPIMFPNDTISFAAGLTPIRTKTYVWISLIGFIPNILILTLFGEYLVLGLNPMLAAFLGVLGVGVLCYVFRHILRVMIVKSIREIEEKTVEIEKEGAEKLVEMKDDIEKKI